MGKTQARIDEKINPRFVLKHCQELGLGFDVLSLSLAVNRKTLERWSQAEVEPNESAIRLLEKLDSIYVMVQKMLKGNERKDWFQIPNPTLGNQTPIDLLKKGEIDQVRNVLGMMEWGIYS